MEKKLIELLNEYDSNWGFTDYGSLFNCMNEGISGTEDLQVISKKFGFIKWLVENNKVKLGNIALQVYNLDLSVGKHTYTEYPIYESLLMLLSISDTPIEDLISYLH